MAEEFDLGKTLKTNEDIQKTLKQKGEQADTARKAAQTKFEFDVNTGMAKIQADSDAVRQILQGYTGFQQIQAHYDQMLAQATAQEQNVRSHPWQNTFAQLAAGIASTDRNPLTAGIGRAATALNPTVDELQARRMAILNQMQQGAGREMHSMLSLSDASRKADLGMLKATEESFKNTIGSINKEEELNRKEAELGIRANTEEAKLYFKQQHEAAYKKFTEGSIKVRQDAQKLREDAAKGLITPNNFKDAQKRLDQLRAGLRSIDNEVANIGTKPPMVDQKDWDDRIARMKQNAAETRRAFEEAEALVEKLRSSQGQGPQTRAGNAGTRAGTPDKYDKAFD